MKIYRKILPDFRPPKAPFTVHSQRVIQGPFTAGADSRSSLRSNFPEKVISPEEAEILSDVAAISEKKIPSRAFTEGGSNNYFSQHPHTTPESAPSPKSFPDEKTGRRWNLTEDISGYPQFQSENILFDALYNLGLEELILNKKDEDLFHAGKEWPKVWTRDLSYAIILSLASIEPEVAKASLLQKVKNGMIIQDTGTGGAWPISTDRMVWVIAAWEIYKVTGDRKWLETVFPIAEKSAAADMVVAWNDDEKLFHGETSFLDWREQTYPSWMKAKDIFSTFSLSTNALMAEAYMALSEMEKNYRRRISVQL